MNNNRYKQKANHWFQMETVSRELHDNSSRLSTLKKKQIKVQQMCFNSCAICVINIPTYSFHLLNIKYSKIYNIFRIHK